MIRKKGFVAVSLIYSFFLIFLMIMLSSSIKNAEIRLMLSTIKEDIKSELEGTSEFIVTSLPNKNINTGANYQIADEVNFVGESWLVVANKSNSVVLILKRALNKKEITESLGVDSSNTDYFAGTCNESSCKVRMCMSSYSPTLCFYESSTNYEYYNWKNSIAKKVVESWLESNSNLQKICRSQYDPSLNEYKCTKDTLIKMTFSIGSQTNSGYIRLATNAEATTGRTTWVVNNGGYAASDAWTLTSQSFVSGKSRIYDLKGNVRQNENTMTIRPVIEVKKG